ncbi:MAG: TIGR03564 family F420-dependent LLM class oxidoreductase [Pseudomonadales bacterium]
MKIGINGTGLVQKASVDAVVSHAQQALDDGFHSYWLAEHPTGGFDALTVLAAVGLKVPTIKLGTAIIPTFPRHPAVLAGQAITVNNLLEGRLTLGIGLSHAPMMAELGIGFDKPIRHLREYLAVLMPLVREGQVDAQGETIQARFKHFREPAHALKVVVAALGPQALGVTGRNADGTVLAWVGEKTIREHIAPRLNKAAEEAGNPAPQIIASLPVCVTDDEAGIRERIGKGLSMYGQLPSYRAMFDREGVDGPADVAIVGSQAQVEDRIRAMAEAGVTEFTPTEFVTNGDEAAATRATLAGFL